MYYSFEDGTALMLQNLRTVSSSLLELAVKKFGSVNANDPLKA
jgi:hypothetical protein